MKKILHKLWERFLTQFGNIKVFKFPMFWIYDPYDYDVTGINVLEVMELIQPGDIVFRYYNHYLDSKFIPGGYSHGGLYIGNGEVIHAIAPNVEKTTIIDFMQCDKIMVLRPKKYQKSAISKAKKYLENKIPYDFMFKRGDAALYCFELVAECYSNLKTIPQDVSIMKLIKRKGVLTSKSFTDSDDFEVIYYTQQK